MHRPLSSWLNGPHRLPERFYKIGYQDQIEDDWSVFITIQEMAPLFEANQMNWISLKEARNNTEEYLNDVSEIINGSICVLVDPKKVELIKSRLGEPPLPSLPLYLISVAKNDEEEVVYVGKTANKNRFSGGHRAALKLHNPKYDGYQKRVYRATVWMHDNSDYISLDWVQPEKLANELLDSIESHLIYSFQPALNTAKKKSDHSKWNFYIHIQNLESGFLNDEFI